jgi:hypothetical protein
MTMVYRRDFWTFDGEFLLLMALSIDGIKSCSMFFWNIEKFRETFSEKFGS